MQGWEALATAIAGVIMSIIALIRTVRNRADFQGDVAQLHRVVEYKTDGALTEKTREMESKFSDMERRLQRHIQERIGMEVDMIREAMKRESEGE